MKQSPTLVMNNTCRELEAQGKVVYKFGFGESPFPVPNVLVEQLKANAAQKSYLPTQGLEQLRKEIAQFYNVENDHDTHADQIVIGPGSKELIFLTQLMAKRRLVIPYSSWVSYAPQSSLAKGSYEWVATNRENGYKITASELDNSLAKHPVGSCITILNYPNNPTGLSYSSKELQEIADVARKHQLIIISDEIYSAFTFNSKHHSIIEYYPEATVITSGLSKWCGAGGWRLGYAVFSEGLEELKELVVSAGSETYSCTTTPVQYAACEAFNNGPEIQKYTQSCTTILKYVANWVISRLSESNIYSTKSDGGFYCLVSFYKYKNELNQHGIHSDQDMCNYLLDHYSVALLPGQFFGMVDTDFNARLAFLDFDGEAILKDHDYDKHLKKLKQGIEQLIAFKEELTSVVLAST